MKLLFFTNSSWNLNDASGSFDPGTADQGWEVKAIAPKDEYCQKLGSGIWEDQKRLFRNGKSLSKGPFEGMAPFREIKEILKSEYHRIW
ncbi:MAG: hypothetical protein R2879_14605 [Saprospiraceae bacterium]